MSTSIIPANRLTRSTRPLIAAIALLLAGVAPALAGPGNVGNPAIAPPQSHFHGQTYSEWSAAFFQWAYSLPVTDHPLFDTADCSEGQAGDVWFIDGTRGLMGFPPNGRNCTIPSGTALFLALAATYADNEGCDPTGTMIQRTAVDEADLRAIVQGNLNGFLDTRRIVIDGVAVKGLPTCMPDLPDTCETPYRVQSPVYDYTVPAFDNLLILDDGPCYNDPTGTGAPYTAHGAVAEGVFVMIKPFPVGSHTIRFGRLNPATGEPGNLYNITVTGAGR